ncbi:MAG: hypothetical protein KAS32_16950 [Candidatus Peribacteraceae bacterium]|nr:hypothetical protein [Candidatus Peribacteraceae bacterium]
MPLVKPTPTGDNFLEKINTDGDTCSRTAIRSYSKQLGVNGYNGYTRFYLPFGYEPSSHTLWVFVNGEKAVVEQSPGNNRQYLESTNKSVTFGASLNTTDVIEFIVAGSYLGEVSDIGIGGGGMTWITTNIVEVNALSDYGYMLLTAPAEVILPAGAEMGDIVGIADAFGGFSSAPTLVTFLGGTVATLDQDWMSAQFVYDGVSNWVQVVTTDHDSLSGYEADEHRPITVSVDSPTGGVDGDIWIKTF